MSNLIEQLGGYEAANSKLLKMDKILKEVYYSHSDAQKANELRQSLLEHRRQHSIFEVGDKVVFNKDKSDNSDLYNVDAVLDDGSFLGITGYRQAFPSTRFTHAADEEIEAGHRLPQLEVLNDIDIPPNTIILGDK